MTVRECFSKAFGEVPEGATCHTQPSESGFSAMIADTREDREWLKDLEGKYAKAQVDIQMGINAIRYEEAEELGAHTGEIAVLGYGDWGGQNEWFPMIWEGKFWTSSGDFVNPTHFRLINPPEN